MGQERMINSKGQTVTVAVFTLGNKFKLKPAFTMIKQSVICHLSNAPLCKRLEVQTRYKKEEEPTTLSAKDLLDRAEKQ